jgi:hypothetical protein
MTKEELKIKLTELYPIAVFDETGEWLNVTVTSNEFLSVMEVLRNSSDSTLIISFV